MENAKQRKSWSSSEESSASAKRGASVAGRCSVFAKTDMIHLQQKGTSLEEIAYGVCLALARNFMATVLKIHPYNRISGAIGAALIAKDRVEKVGKISPDTEVLDKRIHQNYTVSSFECQHCSNHCQVNQIVLEDEIIYFGDTCERYTSQQDSAKRAKTLPKVVASETQIPDLFRERENLIKVYIQNPSSPILKIGLPKTSFMLEYLPFWATFFNELGCELCVPTDSNMGVLEDGLKKLPAETCLPIKIAFGHVQWFENKDVDWIFFPSHVDSHNNPLESVYLCPYCENIPFMVKSALEIKFLTPSVLMNSGEKDFLNSISEVEKALDLSAAKLRHAYLEAHKAQKEFAKKMKERGEEIFKDCEKKKQNIWPVLGLFFLTLQTMCLLSQAP
jgi:hypothetical protein